MDNKNIIHSYKGFDKDLKCHGFAYEIGKDYEQDSSTLCCNNGFHACEFPLDVFNYYAPGGNSRYCAVTQSGVTDKDGGDSKVASSKIHIETEIGLDGIIKAGVKFILDKVNWENQKKLTRATAQQPRTRATYQQLLTRATNQRLLTRATNQQPRTRATTQQPRTRATAQQLKLAVKRALQS